VASQADIIAGILKKATDKAKAAAQASADQRAAEAKAKADPAAAVAADKARREANAAAGKPPQTAADAFLDMADKAQKDGATAAKEAAAAATPPDLYDATLREVARANTQLQMTATNGRAGSVLGIGTDSYTSAQANAANNRITGDPRYGRQTIGGDPNKRQRTQASIFNLPFGASRGLGVTRARF
jgi:hypothetical protein